MDVEKAKSTAKDHITKLFTYGRSAQLDFKEAVYDAKANQWRIAFSFSLPWYKQVVPVLLGRGVTSRDYKMVVIDDANGWIISITAANSPFRYRKCAYHASAQDVCNTEQNEQPSRTTSKSVGLRDYLRSLYRALVVYPGAAVGLSTLVMLYADADMDADMRVLMTSAAAFTGMSIGFFAEGWWWQKHGYQRPDNDRRNRNEAKRG